jgi:double-strand break repair protein MRE11
MQGVWERDECRGNDSFASFREVFEIARHSQVDMVLLGGDLFHENNPSRSTLVKCLQILNEHCLGNDPIRFEVCPSPCLHRLVSIALISIAEISA